MHVSFDVEDAGRYVLKARLTRSWDYGVYSIALDGKTLVDEVDLYAPEIAVKTQKLGEHTLAKGAHKLTFTYVRSNLESKVRGSGETGRYMALDAIEPHRLYRQVADRIGALIAVAIDANLNPSFVT